MEGADNLPPFVINSCMNMISVCIRSLIVSSSNYDSSFKKIFTIIQPYFIINEDFVRQNSVSNELFLIETGSQELPPHHSFAVKILNSVLEYVINSTFF